MREWGGWIVASGAEEYYEFLIRMLDEEGKIILPKTFFSRLRKAII